VNEAKNKIYGVTAERMRHLQEALSVIDQEEAYLFNFTAKMVGNPQLAELMSCMGRLAEIKKLSKLLWTKRDRIPNH